VVQEKIEYLSIDKIIESPQVRKDFPEEEIVRMKDSIVKVGLLQPIRVRSIAESDLYEILDGAMRFRAVKLSKLYSTIAAIVDGANINASDVTCKQLIANCHRVDLTAIETASAIKDLMRLQNWTAAEVAAQLGFSEGKVAKLLPLVELPNSIKTQIEKGLIPATAGYDLSRVADSSEQAALAERIAGGQLSRDGLSGIVKRRSAPQSIEKRVSVARIKAELTGGRSVTVAGSGLDSLDTLIEWMEELIGKARKMRSRGLELSTFARILKDEAKA
jgi:ParB family chromosome partitioning protein